eukprot:scpid29415/ scgid34464/ 
MYTLTVRVCVCVVYTSRNVHHSSGLQRGIWKQDQITAATGTYPGDLQREKWVSQPPKHMPTTYAFTSLILSRSEALLVCSVNVAYCIHRSMLSGTAVNPRL